jgi:2-polyprenyl-3-methyl-5-hydroxy-6-metoxy-1,4-benzoquinol methylase
MWKKNQIESVKQCGMCGSGHSKELVRRPDDLPLHLCLDCGFAYLVQRPNSRALADYYDSGYFQDSQTYQDYFNYAQAIVDLNYCPRLHRLGPLFHNWSGKRVLDIGCAAAGTLAVLKRKGAIVTGIEISEDACRVAEDQFGLTLINDSLENVKLPAEGYDVVLMFDVLEHLQYPGTALDQIAVSLVEHGYLAITVPNFNRYFIEGPGWMGLQGYWEHLNYFTSDVLCTDLKKRGFDIVEHHSYTNRPSSGHASDPRTFRAWMAKLRHSHPVMGAVLRSARKMKFKIMGPPECLRLPHQEGMDLFVLARKSANTP